MLLGSLVTIKEVVDSENSSILICFYMKTDLLLKFTLRIYDTDSLKKHPVVVPTWLLGYGKKQYFEEKAIGCDSIEVSPT